MAAEEGSILQLPYEILELILIDEGLDHKDVCNFGMACHQLCTVSESNDIWKCKLRQRWNGLLDCYSPKTSYDWKQEYKFRFTQGKMVQKYIASMSAEFYKLEEISKSGFAAFKDMLEQHEFGYNYMIDEMMSILQDGNRDSNLTVKYYTEKVIRYIQQINLQKEWEEFLSLDQLEQSLEKGALLVAHWCQPAIDITSLKLEDHFESMAQRVRDVLQKSHQDHPIFREMEDSESQSKPAQLPSSRWNPSQCRQILECVNQVLFQEMGFQGNSEEYYVPDNSFVNKVVETRKGIPITLCIIYEAVARRLGVKCEPIRYPSHFLLRWEEHPELPEPQKYTYIDAFHGGKFLSEKHCAALVPHHGYGKDAFTVAPPVQVFERMARNLIHVGRQQEDMGEGLLCLWNALELLLLICSEDLESLFLLSRVYMHLNVNLEEAVEKLEILQKKGFGDGRTMSYMMQTCTAQMEIQRKEKEAGKMLSQYRTFSEKDVKYAVGLIMKHRRYHYTCVIYAWDATCSASEKWIVRMGVNRLIMKENQPFYNVLVEDGSNRYAAQENLEIAIEPKRIHHPVIGRYFESFHGTYYLPNKEKADEYPDDAKVREELLKTHYLEDDADLS